MAISRFNETESSQADTVDIWVEFNNTTFITFIFCLYPLFTGNSDTGFPFTTRVYHFA